MTKKYPVYKKTPVMREDIFPDDTGVASESVNSVLLWMWNSKEHYDKSYTEIEIKDKVLPDYYKSLTDVKEVLNSELKEIEILHQVYIRECAKNEKD